MVKIPENTDKHPNNEDHSSIYPEGKNKITVKFCLTVSYFPLYMSIGHNF